MTHQYTQPPTSAPDLNSSCPNRKPWGRGALGRVTKWLSHWGPHCALFSAIGAALLGSMTGGCANPGTPTGGPRDRKPPVVVMSNPAQGASDFHGKEIIITFDENIQLKDADQKFVMSPPTAKKPKVEGHAKQVKVSFEDDLLPATTYTLDFADCVSDLNEGNVYKDLTLSFSTGQTQDSMMISGNVYDAATLTPVEGVYVLLHSNLSDTAFAAVTPIRLAKTDDAGRFAIKSVPADADYDVYVLDDQNRNFLYDQPGEQIAWLGHHVRPSWEMRQVPDSVKTDSTYIVADTVCYYYEHILRDTLVLTPDSLTLFAFTQKTYDQYIASDERKERHMIQLAFNCPMETKPQVSFVGRNEEDSSIAIRQYSANNDTVTLWMTDTTVWKRDSVVLAVSYPVLDTLGQMVEKIDTLKEWHFERPAAEPEKKSKRRRKKEEEKVQIPTLKLKLPSNIAPYAELSINSPTPFQSIEWDSVHLYHKVDTLWHPMSYTHASDSVDICHVSLKAKWEAGEQYQLVIDSAMVSDIYGLQTDAVVHKFAVTALEKYGTLYIDVDSVPANALLQLTDSKGKVVRQSYLKPSGKAGFRYLPQGDYMLRVLQDDNRNGVWDTGDYAERRQPEKLIYYMDKITVRPNWDIHVEFNLGDFNVDAFANKFTKKKTKSRR